MRKDRQLLQISKQFAEFSTCLSRKVGCLITSSEGHTISTGYNGAPKKCSHSDEAGCHCQNENRESGREQELLRCSHAELNAIAQAAYEGVSTAGGRLYCVCSPCSFCAKAIVQAGIRAVVFEEVYPDEFAFQLLKEAKVELAHYNGRRVYTKESSSYCTHDHWSLVTHGRVCTCGTWMFG